MKLTKFVSAADRLNDRCKVFNEWIDRQFWYPFLSHFMRILLTILGIWKYLELLVWFNS